MGSKLNVNPDYEKYIHKSRYARWLPETQAREDWDETVGRYLDHFDEELKKLPKGTKEYLRGMITKKKVMPSMRAMMTAGEALEKDNVAGFNCSYLTLDHPRAFDELMYILMCGTGVGFSVEERYVKKLPEIAEEFHPSDTVIAVPDSKIGWSKSFKQLLAMLWAGEVPQWDTSRVRKKGEKLKTFGGRASGPEPLEALFEYAVNLFKNAAGRQLNSYECHLLACKIADIVVVGGVRRSALISLSDLTDDRMRKAKFGNFSDKNPELFLSNNSTCYTKKPDFSSYMDEIHALHISKNGERGFFSRVACQNKAKLNGRRDHMWLFGTNPCCEIILRPFQFCNLSEVVVRFNDTFEDIMDKVKAATILGTLQATQTNFRYLRPIWQKNTEEEALLGVSMTGIMDNPVMSGEPKQGTWFNHPNLSELPDILDAFREQAIAVNKKAAAALGINQAAAVTCVKPSGTVSQLCDTSSGIHPRYAPYYIRRVKGDKKDPMSDFLIDQGVPHEQDLFNESGWVFCFPIKSPDTSVIERQRSSIDFLKVIDIYNKHWCEHKVSATIHYTDDEYLQVMQYLWDGFDEMSGVSLCPYDDHTYQQAPYTGITAEEYTEAVKGFPEIHWDGMKAYEAEDNTSGSQELACTGSKGCDL